MWPDHIITVAYISRNLMTWATKIGSVVSNRRVLVGSGGFAPEAKNQHAKRVMIFLLVHTAYILCMKDAFYCNLSAINIHQTAWHFLGLKGGMANAPSPHYRHPSGAM